MQTSNSPAFKSVNTGRVTWKILRTFSIIAKTSKQKFFSIFFTPYLCIFLFIDCQFLPSFLLLFSKLIFPWCCLFQFTFHSVFVSLSFTFSSPLSFSPNLYVSFSSHFTSSSLTKVAGGMSRSNVQIVLESIHGFTPSSSLYGKARLLSKLICTFLSVTSLAVPEVIGFLQSQNGIHTTGSTTKP